MKPENYTITISGNYAEISTIRAAAEAARKNGDATTTSGFLKEVIFAHIVRPEVAKTAAQYHKEMQEQLLILASNIEPKTQENYYV